MKISMRRGLVGLLVLGFVLVTALPAWAQPGRGPRPPYGPPPPPPPHHHRHGPSDFDKTMRVLGAVGAVAAVAGGYTPYGYYRYSRPVVVVPPSRPTTVVVEKQAPIIVEKIVEKPVIVEKTVPMLPGDHYSPKLGATFVIQNMKIPGYTFTAARLTSNPLNGSPLHEIGLVKGDVITRLDNETVQSLDVLDRHEKNTLIRYIKTGTTRVQQDRIYIPTDAELNTFEEENYYAP